MMFVECIGLFFQFSLQLPKSHANRPAERMWQKGLGLETVLRVASKSNRRMVIIAGHGEDLLKLGIFTCYHVAVWWWSM